MPTPDALRFAKSWKAPIMAFSRLQAIQDASAAPLGYSPGDDRPPLVRLQPDGTAFVTRDPADTLRFPATAPRLGGRPRYAWAATGTPGIEAGTLVLTAPAPSPAKP